MHLKQPCARVRACVLPCSCTHHLACVAHASITLRNAAHRFRWGVAICGARKGRRAFQEWLVVRGGPSLPLRHVSFPRLRHGSRHPPNGANTLQAARPDFCCLPATHHLDLPVASRLVVDGVSNAVHCLKQTQGGRMQSGEASAGRFGAGTTNKGDVDNYALASLSSGCHGTSIARCFHTSPAQPRALASAFARLRTPAACSSSHCHAQLRSS